MELSDFLIKELETKGLARPSEDGVSIPLHPTVRTTILVVLAQLSRRAGTKHGLAVRSNNQRCRFYRGLVRRAVWRQNAVPAEK